MLGRFLLAVTSSVVAIALAELMVRAFALAPEASRIEIAKPYGTFVLSTNPVLRYVPKAGAGDVNAYGIRDRDVTMAKAPGTYRIVVLGDSITYGFCTDEESLPMERVYPKVLERRLTERTLPGITRIEVVNLGVSGYDTRQEAEFLREKGLALQPDLVVIGYCLNDAWTASAELGAFLERAGKWGSIDSPPAWVSEIFHGSALIRFVWQRGAVVQEKVARRIYGEAPIGDVPAEGFAQIAAMARAHRFEVLVTIFPLFEDFEHYTHQADHDGVRTRAAAVGFPVLDLLPAFRRERLGQGRCNREHPDEAGHVLAATELERAVGERIERGHWPAP